MNFTFSRTYRGPLQALIFDWAGTTVDYGSQAPAQIFVKVFARKGVEVSLTEARGPMGMHKRDHIRTMTEMERIAAAWEAVHNGPPDEEDIEDMFQDFIPLQLEILGDYATLIPGVAEMFAACKERGLKIGSTTGYNREMVELLHAKAIPQGYDPDSVVCAADVEFARPAPWMCTINAMNMGVYPFESVVKIDDTVTGITAGLNAGMWTVGCIKSGNAVGLNEAEISALDPAVLERKLAAGRATFLREGAHYVIDGVWDLLPVLDDIEARLARGERP